MAHPVIAPVIGHAECTGMAATIPPTKVPVPNLIVPANDDAVPASSGYALNTHAIALLPTIEMVPMKKITGSPFPKAPNQGTAPPSKRYLHTIGSADQFSTCSRYPRDEQICH